MTTQSKKKPLPTPRRKLEIRDSAVEALEQVDALQDTGMTQEQAGALVTVIHQTTVATFAPAERKMDVMSKDIVGLKADIGDLKVDMGVMKADMGVMSKDIGGLKADVGGLKADIGGLKADMGIMSADIGGLKADMGIMSADIGGLKADVGIMSADIGGLKADMGVMSADIETIKEDIHSLDKRGDNLEVKMEYLATTAEMYKLHGETTEQIGKMSSEIAEMKGQFTSLKWVLGGILVAVGSAAIKYIFFV